MKSQQRTVRWLAGLGLLLVCSGGDRLAQENGTAGPVGASVPPGTIRVPAFDLPISEALSVEARKYLIDSRRASAGAGSPNTGSIKTEKEFTEYVEKFREQLDTGFAKPLADRVMRAFPVTMRPSKIAGVPVEEFEPTGGVSAENKNRALINLHGGAFFAGAVYLGRVESAPIASIGKIRVVSVDYRQGYEHKFPAASEDVAAVYQALLKQYPARNVGIYGCSAGGSLTAQAMAWLVEKGMPTPGAMGIFGAGARSGSGDATYFAAIGNGSTPPPATIRSARDNRFGYFANVGPDNRLVYPEKDPALLAKFPPTLLITATRATDMSSALAMHRALTRAGVDASLQVFDGLHHCFIYQYSLPEVQDANATIVRFFDRHLGRQ